MREITVPNDMTVNLGYRKLKVKAGRRAYPDEVANHPAMQALWDAPEPEPTPEVAPVEPDSEPEPEPETDHHAPGDVA
jgi:hypothetical protein